MLFVLQVFMICALASNMLSSAQSQCSLETNCGMNYIYTEFSPTLTTTKVVNNQAELTCSNEDKGMYAIYSQNNKYVGPNMIFTCSGPYNDNKYCWNLPHKRPYSCKKVCTNIQNSNICNSRKYNNINMCHEKPVNATFVSSYSSEYEPSFSLQPYNSILVYSCPRSCDNITFQCTEIVGSNGEYWKFQLLSSSPSSCSNSKKCQAVNILTSTLSPSPLVPTSTVKSTTLSPEITTPPLLRTSTTDTKSYIATTTVRSIHLSFATTTQPYVTSTATETKNSSSNISNAFHKNIGSISMTNMLFFSFVYLVGIIVVIGLGWTLKGILKRKILTLLQKNTHKSVVTVENPLHCVFQQADVGSGTIEMRVEAQKNASKNSRNGSLAKNEIIQMKRQRRLSGQIKRIVNVKDAKAAYKEALVRIQNQGGNCKSNHGHHDLKRNQEARVTKLPKRNPIQYKTRLKSVEHYELELKTIRDRLAAKYNLGHNNLSAQRQQELDNTAAIIGNHAWHCLFDNETDKTVFWCHRTNSICLAAPKGWVKARRRSIEKQSLKNSKLGDIHKIDD